MLADGLISLQVETVQGDEIKTTILNSGDMSDKKRVAVPDVQINLPFLSEQDTKDIIFGAGRQMDFVTASFVQRAAEVLAIRRVLEDVNANM